jgi:hypothetical protein
MRGRMHWKEARLSGGRARRDASCLGRRSEHSWRRAEPARSAESTTPRHLVESVVMDSGCPALVVPYIGAPLRPVRSLSLLEAHAGIGLKPCESGDPVPETRATRDRRHLEGG